MRVLVVTPLYVPWIGGMEIFVRQLVAELRPRGHDFLVLTSHVRESEAEVDEVDGVPVRWFPVHRALERRDPTAVLHLQREVASVTSRFDPELVHAHDASPMSWLHRVATRREARPRLVTLHTVSRGSTAERLDLRAEELEHANHVVGVSRDVLDDALSYAPSISTRCEVILNGVVPTMETPTPVPVDPPRLACIGRLVAAKGFDRAIAALPHLTARFPEVRLVLAGDGPERDPLIAMASALGVGDRVDFLGFVDRPRVTRLLDESTAVVMPSRFEGLPLVALEAGWCGRPVVATRAPGLDCAVVDGDTALVVDADAEALAAGLARVLADPVLAQRLGDGGRRRAERDHSIAGCASAYEAAYCRVLNRHARAG